MSNWAGILPISFGETSHGSRSSNLDDLFLHNPESNTLHLDRLSSHSAYSGTQMSDYRSLNTSRSERRSTDYQVCGKLLREYRFLIAIISGLAKFCEDQNTLILHRNRLGREIHRLYYQC